LPTYGSIVKESPTTRILIDWLLLFEELFWIKERAPISLVSYNE
jgi:hypothetical protein